MGSLHGAAFLDSGNIWLIRDMRVVGWKLKASRFLKDLALGTGIALRYDLEYLVCRVELGYRFTCTLRDRKSDTYNIPKFPRTEWHPFAIGYPF